MPAKLLKFKSVANTLDRRRLLPHPPAGQFTRRRSQVRVLPRPPSPQLRISNLPFRPLSISCSHFQNVSEPYQTRGPVSLYQNHSAHSCSLAWRFSLASASLFICSFIWEYFLSSTTP